MAGSETRFLVRRLTLEPGLPDAHDIQLALRRRLESDRSLRSIELDEIDLEVPPGATADEVADALISHVRAASEAR